MKPIKKQHTRVLNGVVNDGPSFSWHLTLLMDVPNELKNSLIPIGFECVRDLYEASNLIVSD